MQEKEHIPKQRAAAPGVASLVKQPPTAIETSVVENTVDASLPVRDMETAEELMEQIKASIFADARISMLAQANACAEGLILLSRKN